MGDKNKKIKIRVPFKIKPNSTHQSKKDYTRKIKHKKQLREEDG